MKAAVNITSCTALKVKAARSQKLYCTMRWYGTTSKMTIIFIYPILSQRQWTHVEEQWGTFKIFWIKQTCFCFIKACHVLLLLSPNITGNLQCCSYNTGIIAGSNMSKMDGHIAFGTSLLHSIQYIIILYKEKKNFLY